VLTLTGEGATGRTRTHEDVRQPVLETARNRCALIPKVAGPAPAPDWVPWANANVLTCEGERLELFLLKYTSTFLLLSATGGGKRVFRLETSPHDGCRAPVPQRGPVWGSLP
jgi:hypothetical protein